ncbi:MAG: acyl-CoA reductase [Myxococcota bacterium]|nr:acyl-CoA reductase [Myxococcota bacterium]
MGGAQENKIDALLAMDPYGVEPEVKNAKLLEAMAEAHRWHFENCLAYRRFSEKRDYAADHVFGCLKDFPFMPVQAFKFFPDALTSVAGEDIKVRLQSSATSNVPSTIHVDKITAKRQVRALAAVIGATLGSKRRPFVVMDADPRQAKAGALGARSAAVRGFLNLASKVEYVMKVHKSGGLVLDEQAFCASLDKLSKVEPTEGEPMVLFGFTYVLYHEAALPLMEKKCSFSLPAGSKIVHIGGWKKLEDRKVSKEKFCRDLSSLFGLEDSDIVDFYGFTEQMGITYPDVSLGVKCAPAFSDVIVRDPKTHEVVPDGETGLLQFLTPLPHSYAGISILTDDLGRILPADGGSAWHGRRFEVLGRAKAAEIRGCGDMMAEKVVSNRMGDPEDLASLPQAARLLFAHGKSHVIEGSGEESSILEAPVIEDIHALMDSLIASQEVLRTYSVDEIITLISSVSDRWLDEDSPLAPFKYQGLSFLKSWCQSANLRRLADEALRGHRGYLDGFRPTHGSNRRLLRAVEKGLVAHWLAGNVPLLGMLTLVQSVLCRNANILKTASSFSGVLPLLLETFVDVEIEKNGRVLRGNDILNSLGVVYFPSGDIATAHAISGRADVRLAWGGREAVEAITGLPKKYDAEDIVFGPKLSCMVIGRELLGSDEDIKRAARRTATDVSTFDQYACASPHTIFVEMGSVHGTPKHFGEILGLEMEKALKRIPKGLVDAATSANILSKRLHYDFFGEYWASLGTEWTILYEPEKIELATPTYSRVVTIVPVEDVQEVIPLLDSSIQSVGLGLKDSRKLEFAEMAIGRGVERLPDLGRMTHFDSPWDGMYVMERMVRWVSAGGPM